MRFSLKIIIGYASVCLLTVAMAGLFLHTFDRYQRSNHMIFYIEQVRNREQALQVALYAELQTIRGLIRNPDLAQARRVQENMKKVRTLIEEVRGMERTLSVQLEELNFPHQKFLYFDRFQEDLQKFDTAFSEIHTALIAQSGRYKDDAAALSDRFESKLEKWTFEMNEAWSHDIGQAMTHIQNEKKRTTFILLGLVLSNVVISLLLSIVLVSSVRRLMGRLSAGMRRVSSGDYDKPVELCRDPEMNYLVENFNRMSSELKQLENMRYDFISMLTHDMKSPLTVIKMYAGILSEKNIGDSRSIEAVARNADKMLHLVENFLDFTKSESALIESDLQPVSLAQIASSVMEDCDVLAKSRGVRLISSVGTELPPVMADEAQLERVLQNLVTNGIKYNNEGGSVTVHTLHDNGSVKIKVEDNGMGISRSDQNNLFVKYTRAERTRHIKGTGLGLVVSRAIIRAHGSELTFTSEEGKGTAFSFELKVAEITADSPLRTTSKKVEAHS
ncbi:sensor histidine kinase [Candidatus Moduliflexota bacterium]